MSLIIYKNDFFNPKKVCLKSRSNPPRKKMKTKLKKIQKEIEIKV
jgi:hypothetical protein